MSATRLPHHSIFIAGLLTFLPIGQSWAETYRVTDQAEYQRAIAQVEPGDDIVLANGVWRDFEIVFEASGTDEEPITLRAETPGQVIISGVSNLSIGGQHLIVSGLTFRDGYSPTDTLVSFRTSNAYAHHVRFTENVIDSFNKKNRQQQDHWITLFGRNNQFDRNAVLGKTNKGMTMVVRLDNDESTDNGHIIERNYFGRRDPLGGNGGETIRIGTSFTSRETSGTIIRQNFFERCSGEVEIISMKSEGNFVTENVFFESRGSVVFRHGGRNEVSRNVFLGNGVPDTGGIRVINDRQIIRDNYLEGLRGQKFNGALVVMNGVPNSPQNRYHQVEQAEITNNSFIDVAHIGLGVGTDDERSAVPIDSSITNNLFVAGDSISVGVFDDMSGVTFADNFSARSEITDLKAVAIEPSSLERDALGLVRVTNPTVSSAAGAPADVRPVSRDATGPSFFEKPDGTLTPGKAVRVGRTEAALRQAVEAASPGDTLILPTKTLELQRPLVVDKPLTIRGKRGWRSSSALLAAKGIFRLRAGAQLTLENVSLVQGGSDIPVIHAAGEYYEGAYSLSMQNVKASVTPGIDRAAPLLAADPETFASAITIRKIDATSWPGDLIDLGAEGREGWYLSDLVTIANSSFTNISGRLIAFGRDGRDESTFGPRFSLSGSALSGVGKQGEALALPGIDGLDLTGNRMVETGAFRIKRRVLGYPFEIANNEADGVELQLYSVDGTQMGADFVRGME